MDELKSQKIWVCFFLEKQDDGRTCKKPISAFGGSTGSDPKYAHTWTTYDQARAAADKNGYSAVGFVVPKGYFFLDIDHRTTDDPFVQHILHDFSETYTEYSITGTGVHIYGKCESSKIPTEVNKEGKPKLASKYYQKNSDIGLELYFGAFTNRFAVFSGNVITDKPLTDCTQSILTTMYKFMCRKVKTNQTKPSQQASDDNTQSGDTQKKAKKFSKTKRKRDSELIKLLRKIYKDQFAKLYDDGDISDYPSPSEADFRLCYMIAYCTGPDADTIKKIFSQSALCRDKWTTRDDYQDSTVNRAIESHNGKFHPSIMEHPPFIKFRVDDASPYVSPPLLAQYIRDHLHYFFVRDNGKQGLLIYVYEHGVYNLYAPDMFKGLIKKIIADYNNELVKMSIVNETYQQLTTDLVYKQQHELNTDETVINFQNGLLHITDMDLILTEHTPDLLSTIQIPCDWTDTPPPTPVFDGFMYQLTGGDRGKNQLLLQWIGACLSNLKGWRMKKALFLIGPGDTGKSVLKSLVELLLGKENFIGIDLRTIESRFGTGAIYGTRLAGSSDMSYMTIEELKTFKKITGGDSIFAEFKGQQAFSYTYNGLLWFCMNRLPKFGGDNGKWIYERIMIVVCPHVIPKEKQDKKILDKMYAEREGIVYKGVKALQTVIADGYRFSEPQSVISARQEYEENNNTVITFFQECMTEWPPGHYQERCTTGMIHRVYRAWCQDNGYKFVKNNQEFRDELRNYLGIEPVSKEDQKNGKKDEFIHTINGNDYYVNYGLNLTAKEKYIKTYGHDSTSSWKESN